MLVMLFDDALNALSTQTDLRRIAGAYVTDHRQLADSELRDGVLKAKPQYLHEPSVKAGIEKALFQDPSNDRRTLSRLILIDVLLDEYDFTLPFRKTEERVIAFEQSIVNRSNELELLDLAAGNKDSQRLRNVELYNFVLSVAWGNDNDKSPDEVNLLRRIRAKLEISEFDHRLLEAQLGKYPKNSNGIHTRNEIIQARRHLQSLGLLFAIRDDGDDLDVIPQELASVMRAILGIEIRKESYRELMNR